MIEQWAVGFEGSVATRNKLLIQLHGILGRARKVYGLPANAAADVEKFTRRSSGEIQVFSPEEVWALVRAGPRSVLETSRSMDGDQGMKISSTRSVPFTTGSGVSDLDS